MAEPRDADVELGIDGYDEAVEIGRGGFGTVYRARDLRLRRLVAVKVLHATLDPVNRDRFRREGMALGALSGHPNVSPVHAAGVSATGSPWLATTYFARGSLAARISSGGPMPWTEAVAIGIKLCGALECAHRAGILHRDVKPENVLLSDYDEPLLADFGIARVSGEFETTGQNVTGSFAHTAPELLDGEPPTARSDVYSLASTLYMLLAAAPPFPRMPDEPLAAYVVRIASGQPPDLRVKGIPSPLCEVIEAGLAKRPAERPQSAAAFGERLQGVERQLGRPSTAMVVGDSDAVTEDAAPTLPGSLPSPRRRWRTATIAAGATLVVAVLLWWGFGGSNPSDGGSPSGPGPAGLDDPRSLALDGNGKLYVVDQKHDGIVGIDPNGRVTTISTDPGSVPSQLTAEPATKGRTGLEQIVWADDNGNVHRFVIIQGTDTGGTRPSQLNRPELLFTGATALASAPDGVIYVAVTTDAGARVWQLDAKTGEQRVFAGTGVRGNAQEGQVAQEAGLNAVGGLAVDQGAVYIADVGDNVVWVVSGDGRLRRFAGDFNGASDGDGEPAVEASINGPSGLAFDAHHNLYIAETGGGRIRRVEPEGTIATVAGGVTPLAAPVAVALDPEGRVYVCERDADRIVRIEGASVVPVA